MQSPYDTLQPEIGAQLPDTITKTVYVASPIETFSYPCYEETIQELRDIFKGHRVIPAKGLFKDTKDWLDNMRAFMAHVDLVVFMSDCEGWIGKGVYQEIVTAHEMDIPIVLYSFGYIMPLFALRGQNESNWRKYSEVYVLC